MSNLINSIATQIVIYTGIPIVILGVFGNISNLAVFLSLKTFRENSCAFFLTVMSFFNIGQLSVSLVCRILISGFNVDQLETSLFACKFRNYFLQVLGLISYTCMCLATIDQFLATSLRPRWQQILSIRIARYLCIFSICVWLLHSIPTLVWYSPIYSISTGKTACIILNRIFQHYIAYAYLIFLAGVIPIFITIVFGALAYQQVRQIPYRTVPLVRRELDKQLTNMVLVQVVLNTFYMLPCVIVILIMNALDPRVVYAYVYYFNLAYNIAAMMYYLYFSVSRTVDIRISNIIFYVFFCSVDSILHLYDCIKTFSSTVFSCFCTDFSPMLQTKKDYK